MKKTLALILASVMLLFVFAGCGGQAAVDLTPLEKEIARLDGEIAALREAVVVLEAENEALKAQLELVGTSGVEQPESDYNPIAELNIYDWTADGETLTIHAFARVMALAKGDGTIGRIESCTLVLRRNDVGWETRELELLPGEASDSMELELEGAVFSLTELEGGDSLELRLEVRLTDGTTLTAIGGGWDYVDGQLMMIAG